MKKKTARIVLDDFAADSPLVVHLSVFLSLIFLFWAGTARGASGDRNALRQRGQELRTQGQTLKGQYQTLKNKQASLEAEKAKVNSGIELRKKRIKELYADVDKYEARAFRGRPGALETAGFQTGLTEKWIGEFNGELVQLTQRQKEIEAEIAQLERQKNHIRGEYERIRTDFQHVKTQYYQHPIDTATVSGISRETHFEGTTIKPRRGAIGTVKGGHIHDGSTGKWTQSGGHLQKGSTKSSMHAFGQTATPHSKANRIHQGKRAK